MEKLQLTEQRNVGKESLLFHYTIEYDWDSIIKENIQWKNLKFIPQGFSKEANKEIDIKSIRQLEDEVTNHFKEHDCQYLKKAFLENITPDKNKEYSEIWLGKAKESISTLETNEELINKLLTLFPHLEVSYKLNTKTKWFDIKSKYGLFSVEQDGEQYRLYKPENKRENKTEEGADFFSEDLFETLSKLGYWVYAA